MKQEDFDKVMSKIVELRKQAQETKDKSLMEQLADMLKNKSTLK